MKKLQIWCIFEKSMLPLTLKHDTLKNVTFFLNGIEGWFIQRKLRIPEMLLFFSNLKPRNSLRDFRGLYFNLKTLCFEKCQIKLNYFFGKPPGGLLSLILEKSNISAFICIEKFLSGIHAHKHLKIFDFKIISGGHGERFILQSEQKNEICLGDSVLWKNLFRRNREGSISFRPIKRRNDLPLWAGYQWRDQFWVAT